jgi:hypothetical protein
MMSIVGNLKAVSQASVEKQLVFIHAYYVNGKTAPHPASPAHLLAGISAVYIGRNV